MQWLLAPDQAPLVGVVALFITIGGFCVTVWALWKTYKQAEEAELAADAAKVAVGALQFRIDGYSAFRDVNEAMLNIDGCKKHLRNEAWRDASDVYEAAHRAVVRLTLCDIDFGRKLSADLVKLATHTKAFCDQVDAALVGKGELPDRAKVYSAIRDNYKILSAASSFLEKRAAS